MRLLSAASLVCAVLTACAQPYTPKISLDESPKTIPLRVEFHTLRDSPKTPGQPYGVVAEHVKAAEPGELSVPTTQAILNSFRENAVFKEIDTQVEHPDAILSGTIKTLYETYRPKAWTQVHGAKSVAKLIDADTYSAASEVELDFVLRTPTGRTLGTYHGHAAKTDEFVPNKQNQPGIRSNWALSEAVRQVRQAMFDDEKLIMYSADNGSPSH